MELYQSEWHQGVSDNWVFKLNHLQPVEQILVEMPPLPEGFWIKYSPKGLQKLPKGWKLRKWGIVPNPIFLLSSLFLCTNLLRESFLSTPPGIHGSTWGVLTPLLFMRHWMKRGNCPSLWLSNHQVDLVPLWPFFQLYPWNVARPPRILMRPWLRLPCLVHLDNGPL